MFKVWRMACIIVLIVFCTTFPSKSMAIVSPITDTQSAESGMDAQWLYESPLTVFEVITPLAEGQYKYSYSFLNSDVNHIWHFAVYTTFDVQDPFTPWSTFESWFVWWSEMEQAYPVYDIRQLNPDLVMVTNTWYGSGPDFPYPENSILPGVFVEGFSFVSSVWDPTPKHYMYETLESGYGPDSGHMAAVGMTEPGTVAAHQCSWGNVKALFR